MSVGIAFRAFFAALFDRATAERIRLAMDIQSSGTENGQALPNQHITGSPPDRGGSTASRGSPGETGQRDSASSPALKAGSTRSEALTLLSALQREARLVDLICEPLDQFSDAQIGAAAREVLRDSRQTLERLFAIAPLADQEEGETLAVTAGTSAARVRLLGKSQGSQGVIVHRGWKAAKCELPHWQGDRSDALVLMPTEVEVS